MGMLSEVKCARCDRRYSGLRSRCPYCGARRIGRGKYSGENDSSTGKMLVAILILVVLISAVVVLLVSSGGEADPDVDATDSVSPSPTSSMPDEGSNTEIENSPVVSPPDVSVEPSDTPSPVITINSITITYNGSKTVDFTMKTGDPSLPLGIKIDPADINLEELGEKIEWISSNTSVFEVVATDTTGLKAKVTAIGAGNEKLTVKIGEMTAVCDVRVRKS